MLTCDDRILLTEFLGELYFESNGSYYLGGLYTDGNLIPMRSFTTWQDTGDLKKRIVEMGRWGEFMMVQKRQIRVTDNPNGMTLSEWVDWLIDPIRFPELVAEWLKERRSK